MSYPRIPKTVYHPELVTKTKKSVLFLIATAGWIIWLYIMLPLIAVLAWAFGYQRLEIFVLSDSVRTFQTLKIYASAIAVGGALFILWAMYNWLRFHARDRRGSLKQVSAQDIGHTFGLEEIAVLRARQEKNADFSFNADGQIISIEPHRSAINATALGSPQTSPDHDKISGPA